MKKEELEKICKQKEQELLGKYFGKLVHKAAIERSEVIGSYEKDLLCLRCDYIEDVHKLKK